MDISFPDVVYSAWTERDSLGFGALVDGKSVRCWITREAFLARFGENPREEADARAAYGKHRPAIQALARGMIERGELVGGEVVILGRRARE